MKQFINCVFTGIQLLNIYESIVNILIQMQIYQPVNQIILLRNYISTLEIQNSTKDRQRQTLYIQLQSLSSDYKKLQEKLDSFKPRNTSQIQNKFLQSTIAKLNQQIQVLKCQQEHLFNENIQILQNLQINQRRINDLEDENIVLRKQKQELQKFRHNLNKISESLQFIEQQKQQLSSVNFQLLQQNHYLKSMIQCSQNQLKRQSLLVKSFEKIQQYDQEFQESHQSSQKLNHSKTQRGCKANLHDYLMEELSRSYQMNESLDKSNLQVNQSKAKYEQKAQKSQMQRLKDQNIKEMEQENSVEQESCDVIQDMYEELSLNEAKRQSNFLESTVKLDQLRKDKIELQKKYEQLCFQKQKLQYRVKEMLKAQAINTKQMQNKIQAVIENYEKIQKVVKQREKQIQEMYDIIQNIERDNQELSSKLYEKENLIRQSMRANRRQGENSILKNVTKQTLIKQNNLLIQMINTLQRQKNEIYIEMNHGKQNRSYGNNFMNSQDPRVRETVAKIQKRAQNKGRTQPKKNCQLKKRIQRIRLQNQVMLQNLAIQ